MAGSKLLLNLTPVPNDNDIDNNDDGGGGGYDDDDNDDDSLFRSAMQKKIRKHQKKIRT